MVITFLKTRKTRKIIFKFFFIFFKNNFSHKNTDNFLLKENQPKGSFGWKRLTISAFKNTNLKIIFGYVAKKLGINECEYKFVINHEENHEKLDTPNKVDEIFKRKTIKIFPKKLKLIEIGVDLQDINKSNHVFIVPEDFFIGLLFKKIIKKTQINEHLFHLETELGEIMESSESLKHYKISNGSTIFLKKNIPTFFKAPLLIHVVHLNKTSNLFFLK
jgi:hypothetical protein